MLWIFFLIVIFIMHQKNAFDQNKFQISCTGLKFSFSEKATKIAVAKIGAISFIVWSFTFLLCKRPNHENDFANFCGLLRKAEL